MRGVQPPRRRRVGPPLIRPLRGHLLRKGEGKTQRLQRIKYPPRISRLIREDQRACAVPAVERLRERHRRANLRRIKAFSLFGCFAGNRVQAIESHGFGDGALRSHGADAAHTQFCRFLNDKIGRVALHWREQQIEFWNRARAVQELLNAHSHGALGLDADTCTPLAIICVEHAHRSARLQAQHGSDMAGLGLVKRDLGAERKELIDKKANHTPCCQALGLSARRPS